MATEQQPKKLYQLKTALRAARPRGWCVHLRYAALLGGQEIGLQAGDWLLDMELAQAWGGQNDPKTEYLYRLATGELVAFDHPLTEVEAAPVTDAQAVAAMNAYRAPEEATFDDWGVNIDHVHARSLPPFSLIKCPLCSGVDFVSVDFAAVYCNRCNTRFEVDWTAGDPGWVVRADWNRCNFGAAAYLMPKYVGLSLRVVLKNSSDPRDMTPCVGSWWAEQHGCTPEKLNLTGEDSSLRPGLHACQIGDLYEWQFDGYAPVQLDIPDASRAWLWQIDGESWPQCTYIRATGLTYDDRETLKVLRNDLQRQRAADPLTQAGLTRQAERLSELVARPHRRPSPGYPCRLPALSGLNRAEDERYLLHHWLTYSLDNYLTAWPVWYVVKPILSDPDTYGYRRIENWQVTRRDVCPSCARPVNPADLAAQAQAVLAGVYPDSRQGWRLPHNACRQVWERGWWGPYQDALTAAREKQAAEISVSADEVECLTCGCRFDVRAAVSPEATCPECGSFDIGSVVITEAAHA